MAKYRKKPMVIEAIQYAGVKNADEAIKFVGEDNITTSATSAFAIKTLEGDMAVAPGDYIIKGIKGEFYPCKPDIFNDSYEMVNDKDESFWEVIVAGTKLIQALYHKGSISSRDIQILIDRYERGERTEELKEALQKVEY